VRITDHKRGRKSVASCREKRIHVTKIGQMSWRFLIESIMLLPKKRNPHRLWGWESRFRVDRR
jgi:hypothetical protein